MQCPVIGKIKGQTEPSLQAEVDPQIGQVKGQAEVTRGTDQEKIQVKEDPVLGVTAQSIGQGSVLISRPFVITVT